jgi:MFS transporter, FHS family, L-fucose permease
VVGRIGYKASMVIALAIMGTGALLFLPAADLASYPLFLAALFVLASGITLLQVSCNPYVLVLGPPETASSRLNLAQAFNSLGAAIAPWLGGMLIFTLAPHRLQDALPQSQMWRLVEVSSVKLPYLIFAGVLFISAAVVWRFRLPVVASVEHEGADVVVNGRTATSAWQVRHLVLGALGIMLYCGAEVSIGSFIINFLAQPEIGGMSSLRAARFASYYWTGAMIGRFAGSALLCRIRQGKLLGICAVAASLLVWVTLFSTGSVAVWSIVIVGLFNSIMFPTIFTLGIDGMGKLTSQASGILFLGVVGSATLPVVQGTLADRVGIHHAFILPALYYLYVVYYGFRGSRHT